MYYQGCHRPMYHTIYQKLRCIRGNLILSEERTLGNDRRRGNNQLRLFQKMIHHSLQQPHSSLYQCQCTQKFYLSGQNILRYQIICIMYILQSLYNQIRTRKIVSPSPTQRRLGPKVISHNKKNNTHHQHQCNHPKCYTFMDEDSSAFLLLFSWQCLGKKQD